MSRMRLPGTNVSGRVWARNSSSVIFSRLRDAAGRPPRVRKARAPDPAPEVPGGLREVLRGPPLPHLDHPDGIALLREAARGDAASEPRTDDNGVEVHGASMSGEGREHSFDEPVHPGDEDQAGQALDDVALRLTFRLSEYRSFVLNLTFLY